MKEKRDVIIKPQWPRARTHGNFHCKRRHVALLLSAQTPSLKKIKCKKLLKQCFKGN